MNAQKEAERRQAKKLAMQRQAHNTLPVENLPELIDDKTWKLLLLKMGKSAISSATSFIRGVTEKE
jgi:hypothetical protein